MYVIFENPGEIEPLAISTFGVSVKEGENPIGFFGTGLKYALAILLRTGHKVCVQSGGRTHNFGVVERTIRGQPFNVITMDGERLGFTDAVGKAWEVWMAYRELYCNCRDESGSVYADSAMPQPEADVTRVIVEGDDFYTQHQHRDIFIIEDVPLLALDGCDVHKGESRGVFYRGMLVYRMPKTQVSKFTYNITRRVDLTEDRTAKYPTFLPMYLAASILRAEDDGFLREVLGLPDNYYEHEFNYRDEGVWGTVKPTDKFIAAVETLSKDRAARTNVTAVTRYKQVKRAELMPGTTPLRGVEGEILDRAVAFIKKLGFNAEEYLMIVTDTLGPGILGMAEGGRIYISRRAFMIGTKTVAGTLIEELLHLKHGLEDESRNMQNFLIDRLVSLGEEMTGEPL